FSADNLSEAGKLYRGASPSNDGTELSTDVMPEGFPMTISPERREEFSPGLDPDLLALIQATAEVELQDANNPKDTTATSDGKGRAKSAAASPAKSAKKS
ncbi:MAG: hypothetical protein WAL27_17285, partial [Cellulosimicrobium cellulans]